MSRIISHHERFIIMHMISDVFLMCGLGVSFSEWAKVPVSTLWHPSRWTRSPYAHAGRNGEFLVEALSMFVQSIIFGLLPDSLATILAWLKDDIIWDPNAHQLSHLDALIKKRHARWSLHKYDSFFLQEVVSNERSGRNSICELVRAWKTLPMMSSCKIWSPLPHRQYSS